MAVPIVPSELDPAATVTGAAALVVDDGVNVQKATPLQVVDAARPLASQAEAETGTDNVKFVSSLRVAQAIAALGVTSGSLTAGLATKEPLITPGTTSQYLRGDKTFQALNKAAVGLSNVDNTTDAAKPISTATQTALNTKVTTATLAGSGGAASVGTTADGTIQQAITNTPKFSQTASYPSGTLGSKLKQALNPRDAPYNAKFDGVTDDYAAIQAAIDTGRDINCEGDNATIRITQPLKPKGSYQAIAGFGSTLLLDDASGLLSNIDIGDDVTQLNAAQIKDFIFTRVQSATAGAAIRARYVGDLDLSGCRIFGDGKIFRGVNLIRAIRTKIDQFQIENTVSNGIRAAGTGLGANQTTDLTVNDSRIEGTSGDAITTFDYTEGLYLRDLIIYNINGACVSANAANDAAGLVSFKAYDCDFDTATVGVFANFVDNWTLSNNWLSNLSSHGYQIEQCDSLTITGGQIYASGRSVSLGAAGGSYCRNVIISAVQMAGGTDGVYIGGNNVSYVTIGGGSIIRNMSGYAVNKFLGGDRLMIAGLMAHDNATGNISAGGSNVTLGTNALS